MRGQLETLYNMRESTFTYLVADSISFSPTRGSAFLKRWMEFLEENADLRYPDVSSLALES